MSQRFQTLEDGTRYRLSDGTELSFLTRNGEHVSGVSVEELLGVLIARVDYMRKQAPPAGRFLSLTITELEAAENWMNRWDDTRKLLLAEAAV